MSSFEETIRGVLVRTVPPPATVGLDWDDVLARSATSTKTARTRRLVYSVAFAAVVAIVLAATPLGAMIARGFGDFSGWLSGSTGHPASTGEQQTFAHEYKNSWIRFPKTPALRSLIRVNRDGIDYELFGFRAGDAFCLRLVSSSTSRSTYTSCAPKSDLLARRAPVLLLSVDAPIVDRVKAGRRVVFVQRAGVTFGITSDGVTAVRASAPPQSHDLKGIVGGDSFLIVNPRAAFGAHIASIRASNKNGNEVAVPIARSFFDTPVARTSPTLPGPTKVERPVTRVSVGWIARREPRGAAYPMSRLRHPWQSAKQRVVFARLLTPDPGGVEQVLVILNRGGDLCIDIVAKRVEGGSCSPLKYISKKFGMPFTLMSSGGNPGRSQYTSIVGLADDQVARMTLFLANGEQLAVPLKDNAFLAEVASSKLPYRLVAYDRAGRVIGISPGFSPFPVLHYKRPTGPDKAERPVTHVKIAWIARREPRGTAVPPGVIRFRKSTFRRLLAPDPGGVSRVVVYIDQNNELCFGLVLVDEAGTGCAPLEQLSTNWPLPFTLGAVSGGSGQYAYVFGLADDEIARMTIFLADGERVAVPLKDNAFVIEAARSKYPFRLVAHDRAGLIVGVKTIQDPSIFRATARKSPPR